MVVDRKELKRFLEFFAPGGLGEDEAIFLVLIARKKYCKEDCPIKKGERYLAVRLITGPLSMEKLETIMYDRLEEWYTTKWMHNGAEIPQYTLSASVFKDTLDLEKVSKKFALQVMNLVLDGQYGKALDFRGTISHVAMKGNKKKKRIMFDVDVPGDEGFRIAQQLVDGLNGLVIKTHGGYHVVAEPPRDHNVLLKKYEGIPAGVEYKGLSLVAVPGTLRGGSKVTVVL